MMNDMLEKTSILLDIPTDHIKKDYLVTKAIQALTRIEDKYFPLIFQGGTSLSKGHQIISRLSEDINFRVVLKPSAKKPGKSTLRNLFLKKNYSPHSICLNST